MNEQLVVRRETQIAAPPATVFAFLTDPEKILAWMGTEATAQLHPGGLYLLKGVGGQHARVARGAFREGLKTVMVSDAVSSFDRTLHQATLANFAMKFGWVMATDEVLATL